MIKEILFVAAGGGIGAGLRYAVYLLVKTGHFPLPTLLINIAGSFVLGMVIALSLKQAEWPAAFKLFLATGVCGGFTTFSTFSYENLSLIEQGKIQLMLLYVSASVIGGIAAALLGYRIVYA